MTGRGRSDWSGWFVCLIGALLLTACGGEPGNPSQLWLASKGDELHLQLSPVRPNPF